MARWDGPPEPYPDDAGVRARLLPGPVGRPERARDTWTATRRDGSTCDLRATLGMGGSAPGRSPDELVPGWYQWPG